MASLPPVLPAEKARPQKSTANFFGKLQERIKKTDSLLCVGLDPHAADLPEQTGLAALAFCVRIIDCTKHVAAAYKPNSAFFEALGAPGIEALQAVVQHIPDDIPVLLDTKRGDISSTAKAYASAAFDVVGADAVTLSPYMGADSIEPFTEVQGRAVFMLCKTSNKTADELQSLKLANGGMHLYEHVARLASGPWTRQCSKGTGGCSNIGLVVGATDVDALRRVRAAAPDLWILAPGVGAQGGDLEGVLEAGLRSDGSGVLITVSRGISRALSPKAAAENLCKQIAEVRARGQRGSIADAAVAAGDRRAQLQPYQRRFIETALKLEVLRFGSFTLKSGRLSPYFFNAGLFRTGAAMMTLSRCYATAIERAGIEFDVLFGPAYKGIPLVTGVAMTLADMWQRPVPFAYNRKEKKDHGEGGNLVGADMAGKRVLILDDVITAGTAVREAIGMLKKVKATAVAVALSLDRQEVVKEGSKVSAVEVLAKEQGLKVFSIITLRDLTQYASNSATVAAHYAAIQKYRDQYGSASSQ